MFGKSSKFSLDKPRDSSDDWVSTFADMVVLLLTFFIMLAAISTPNVTAYEQVRAGVAQGVGKRRPPPAPPIKQAKSDMERMIKELKIEDKVGLSINNQGILLDFATASLFAQSSAEIDEQGQIILNKIAVSLCEDRYSGLQIEVQGHADNTPISTPQFPSNWELSSARASSVVRLMTERGIAATRLRAVGLADTAPKVPNQDPFGAALPQNQQINRRVVIRIYPQ